jgi:hypothetical protein
MVTFAQKIQKKPLVQFIFDLTFFCWYNAKIQPKKKKKKQ